MKSEMNVQTDLFFSHSPLPSRTSIRLVRRDGIDANGMINISLKTIDLAGEPLVSPYDNRDPTVPERPPFHCLSYTWGNPHANGNIFEDKFKAHEAEYEGLVDIKCDGKILKIQKNLANFFHQAPTDWIRSIRGRIRPHTGKNLLHDRAASGNHKIVHMYAGQGIDVNVQDRMGRTPLHYAAHNGMLETTKILIKAGTTLDLKDKEGQTAEDLANANDHSDIVELLRMCEMKDIQQIVKDVPQFIVENPDTYIWIDAISIDQTNYEEREAQVQIMNHIYSLATYTIIWLGEEDEYTGLAISTISKLTNSAKQFMESDLVPYRTHTPEEYAQFNVPFISQHEWNALAAVFLRQWFRRIWVIQEAVLAKAMVMYSGKKDIGWNNLQIAAEVIASRGMALGHQPSTIYVPLNEIAWSIETYFLTTARLKDAARELEESKNANLTIHFELNRLVTTTLPFLATDPRDKIYALLALFILDPHLKHMIRPDYSISVEQCYASFTKLLIVRTDSIDTLSHVQDSSSKRIHGLPSWVPDFSISSSNALSSKWFSTAGELNKGKPVFNLHLEWNELGLQGVCIDVVTQTAASRPLGGPNPKFKLDESWFDLLEAMGTSERYNHLHQSPGEVLWRTLCTDLDLEHNSPAPPEFRSMFKRFLCAMICEAPEMVLRTEEATRENANRLKGLLFSALSIHANDDAGPQTQGPDESITAEIRDARTPTIRTIHTEYFDCIRHIFPKLEKALSKELEEEKCIPTANEIYEYFKTTSHLIFLPNDLVQIPPGTEPYVLAHSRAYGRRRLFATKSGYLGLGPVSVEAGDTVWIVPGFDLPLLLRHFQHTDAIIGPQRLNLVGEAYVHGIMRGEAVEKLTDRDLTDFILT